MLPMATAAAAAAAAAIRRKLLRALAVISLLYVSSFILICASRLDQRFLEQPESITLSQGQVHTFRCTVENRVGMVQWLRNGFGLGPGTTFEGYPRYTVNEDLQRGEFHLTIRNIQLEDDAVFECQVGATSSTTGMRSSQAKLTVQLPPDHVFITGGPRLNVISEESHVLECHAKNGKPAPEISWFREGISMKDSINYTWTVQADGKRVDAKSQLTIFPNKTDHRTLYTCSVINAAMMESKSVNVQLEVLYRPEVSMSVSPRQPIKEFGSMQLTCSAIANPDPITWRWYKDDVVMPEEKFNWVSFPQVTRDLHRKRISCEATNSVGSSKETFRTNMEYGPRFISEPDDPSADLGGTVTVICGVDSNPTAAVIWRKKDSTRILSTQNRMHIREVKNDDFTTFTCSATVHGYAEIHQDIKIVRRGRPVIVSDAEQSSRFGDSGTVECLVESSPKPDRITWAKNGVIFNFDKHNRYRVREEHVRNGVRSVVEIATVQDEDFAEYDCSVKNSYGTDHMVIHFTKKEVVPWLYIIVGIVVGILFIVIICITVFVYRRRRRKSSDSDSNSRSSSSSISVKKMNNMPHIKVEYSTSEAVDIWKDSLPEEKFPHHSTEYDELRYTNKDPGLSGLPGYFPDRPGVNYDYGVPKGYIQGPYFRPNSSENFYGTYPRGMSQAYYSRGENAYGPVYGGSDTYATYGRLPRRDHRPIVPVPQPPASPTGSKLSTNV